MRCVPFFLLRCETDGLRGGYLAFYVFTGIVFSVGPPGGVIFFSYVFTGILFSVGPPGAPFLC